MTLSIAICFCIALFWHLSGALLDTTSSVEYQKFYTDALSNASNIRNPTLALEYIQITLQYCLTLLLPSLKLIWIKYFYDIKQ